MEQVLTLYERPADPNRPRICFDERPCQLLDGVVAPLLMKPDKPTKEDNDGAARAVCAAGHGGGVASV